MAAKQKDTTINTSMKNHHDYNEDVSRVCIKNLPPSCNESDLRSHLTIKNSSSTNSNTNSSSSNSSNSSKSKCPNVIITDCKILRTKDGKSRKLAFVGFKTSNVSTVGTKKQKDVFVFCVCVFSFFFLSNDI